MTPWADHLALLGLELSAEDLVWEFELRLQEEEWSLRALDQATAAQQSKQEVQKRLNSLATAKGRQYMKQRMLVSAGVTEEAQQCHANDSRGERDNLPAHPSELGLAAARAGLRPGRPQGCYELLTGGVPGWRANRARDQPPHGGLSRIHLGTDLRRAHVSSSSASLEVGGSSPFPCTSA